MNLKRKLLCEWLDYHVGHPEPHADGSMMLYCKRCESLNHAILPSEVDQMIDSEVINR